MKTISRDDAYFSRTFLVFELTQYLFELEQINPINIFIALKILKLEVGLCNNIVCTHKYFSEATNLNWFKNQIQNTYEK